MIVLQIATLLFAAACAWMAAANLRHFNDWRNFFVDFVVLGGAAATIITTVAGMF